MLRIAYFKRNIFLCHILVCTAHYIIVIAMIILRFVLLLLLLILLINIINIFIAIV